MPRIGILAYGSLISYPGEELTPLICGRIESVKTPFSVEFARSSNSRSGAPTLITVEEEGARVNGVILVLNEAVDDQQAEDLLWRRETGNECSDKHYSRRTSPGTNRVVVESLQDIANVETVLFTKIGVNIKTRTPEHLADLAICSARREAGARQLDGISYLISVARQGIQTPLLREYKAAILRKTGASDLDEALARIGSGDA